MRLIILGVIFVLTVASAADTATDELVGNPATDADNNDEFNNDYYDYENQDPAQADPPINNDNKVESIVSKLQENGNKLLSTSFALRQKISGDQVQNGNATGGDQISQSQDITKEALQSFQQQQQPELQLQNTGVQQLQAVAQQQQQIVVSGEGYIQQVPQASSADCPCKDTVYVPVCTLSTGGVNIGQGFGDVQPDQPIESTNQNIGHQDQVYRYGNQNNGQKDQDFDSWNQGVGGQNIDSWNRIEMKDQKDPKILSYILKYKNYKGWLDLPQFLNGLREGYLYGINGNRYQNDDAGFQSYVQKITGYDSSVDDLKSQKESGDGQIAVQDLDTSEQGIGQQDQYSDYYYQDSIVPQDYYLDSWNQGEDEAYYYNHPQKPYSQ